MIPKAKVLVYALTFLGYVYSGYGAGLLGNLREAVLSAENIFGNVLETVVSFTKEFKHIHESLDDAAEEICKFQCPSGIKPVKNKYYEPKPNGCGQEGSQVNMISQYMSFEELTTCCNEHDICYGTCNKQKETCDFDFRKCLYKICDQLEGKSVNSPTLETISKGCKYAAKTAFTSTMTFGCKYYKAAQAEACFCPPPKRRKYAATEEL
uniref:Group XIIA secretory phospholipase A2 n=1 Tax=Cacopsylla melanoneura TaxID=428564 RepID=A0A8D9EB86_9HEMI